MVLGDTACATCAWILPFNDVRATTAPRTMRRSWRASVLHGRPEPGLRVRECYTDQCWKQQDTTDAWLSNMWSDTSVCQSSFPQAYNAILYKWLNFFSSSTHSSTGMVLPYSECCKHCSPLTAPQLLPAKSKQSAQRQVSWAPSDRRWPWQMNQDTTTT